MNAKVLILTLGIIIVTLTTLEQFYEDQAFQTNGAVTTGIVTKNIHKHRPFNREHKNMSFLEYQFNINDQQYTGKSRIHYIGSFAYEEGQKIKIQYLKSDPSKNRYVDEYGMFNSNR